ncbi:MAG: Asp-tRNA(Asn)/Glu-tRNA(Gln) amidotransferase subunit GatB [Bacillota bacterium]
MNNNFKTIIGLEIHAQLKTKSKMFCRCRNNQELAEPNTDICPICMGMPGTLPVPNCKAIEMTIKLGLALGCKISKISKFDRKHYFYPDLPKGYQISQYDQPFCEGGAIELNGHKIRLNRIHLEEDAGKLIHDSRESISKVDLNRAGTPLAEIVTEPDINSPEQAREFLKELQMILRGLGVSAADMEKGHLRSDANINIVLGGKSSPIIEIKNLNSFKFLYQALTYERSRLIKEFEKFDGKRRKITRGFDSKSGKTYPLREKEEAKDYRYFPEPDTPPFEPHKMFDLDKLRSEIIELPSALRSELEEAGIDQESVEIIIKDKEKIKAVREAILADRKYAKIAASLVINEKDFLKLRRVQRNQLLYLINKEKLTSNIARLLVNKALGTDKDMLLLHKTISANENLDLIIDKVLAENKDAFEKLKNGKKEVMGFLIGQVMKSTNGQCDPKQVNKIIMERAKK